MTEQTYEGWTNRQTWNVALHIANNYTLYTAACEFMRQSKLRKVPVRYPYAAFIRSQGLVGERTPDNIAWLGTRLNYEELNQFMHELLEGEYQHANTQA